MLGWKTKGMDITTDGTGWLFQKEAQRDCELPRMCDFTSHCVDIVNIKQM